MKKYLLPVLIWLWGAAVASGWMAFALLSEIDQGVRNHLLTVMILASSATVSVAVFLCISHWGEGEKK